NSPAIAAAFLQQLHATLELERRRPWKWQILLANWAVHGRRKPMSGHARKRENGAAMARRGLAFVLIGLLLGGCMPATLEQASEANFTARDRKLLADPPYGKVSIPTAFQRAIVQYHRKEAPGTVVVDTDARYLYYVLPDGRAIRYGVIVGEEALSWYGV